MAQNVNDGVFKKLVNIVIYAPPRFKKDRFHFFVGYLPTAFKNCGGISEHFINLTANFRLRNLFVFDGQTVHRQCVADIF